MSHGTPVARARVVCIHIITLVHIIMCMCTHELHYVCMYVCMNACMPNKMCVESPKAPENGARTTTKIVKALFVFLGFFRAVSRTCALFA